MNDLGIMMSKGIFKKLNGVVSDTHFVSSGAKKASYSLILCSE